MPSYRHKSLDWAAAQRYFVRKHCLLIKSVADLDGLISDGHYVNRLPIPQETAVTRLLLESEFITYFELGWVLEKTGSQHQQWSTCPT